MKHIITAVDEGSVAQELGVNKEWYLVSIDGEEIIDIVDYEHLCMRDYLTACFESPDGEELVAEIEKDEYEPLGLTFESGLMSKIRSCKNHCMFCFIDQMPPGVRDSLHVKDDDWRLSFIMGNYITLTNVSDAEFERIIKRKVSPLYISVHTTDPTLRVRMMANPSAGLIKKRLDALKNAGLRFHAQIVLCPDINDGAALDKTLNDLFSLYPCSQTVAVVPVGLTRYRNGLSPLRCFMADEAGAVIDQVEAFAEKCKKACRESFAYVSDEMYVLAGRKLPPYSYYGDFLQIENGVGLLRSFEYGFLHALEEIAVTRKKTSVGSVCGVSASAFMKGLFSRLEPYGVCIDVHPVKNRYFGETVTVSGLLCGCDIVEECRSISADIVLLPKNMLREGENVFLDGMTLDEAEALSKKKLLPMPAFDGEDFINELFEFLKEV